MFMMMMMMMITVRELQTRHVMVKINGEW